jgi:hypothetical protein
MFLGFVGFKIGSHYVAQTALHFWAQAILLPLPPKRVVQ